MRHPIILKPYNATTSKSISRTKPRPSQARNTCRCSYGLLIGAITFLVLQQIQTLSQSITVPRLNLSLPSWSFPSLCRTKMPNGFLPLKDLSRAKAPLEGATWFMSSLNDTFDVGEVEYLHFPSYQFEGQLLCLAGSSTKNGTLNWYNLVHPDKLPPGSRFLPGITFVSESYYGYDNICHGLFAMMPFAAWHYRKGCVRPDRWVLYHRGEVRRETSIWVRNFIELTFGEKMTIEKFEGDRTNYSSTCFEEAVVFRHNEGKMLKHKKIQVYEMLRCKSREYCKIQERVDDKNVIIKLTLLLRNNSRCFKDESTVINTFRKECAKVKGCRLKVTRPYNLTFCNQGNAINFSSLDKSPKYPLIDGGSVKSNSSDVTSASHCEPGTLDGNKTMDKIVVCKHSQSDSSRTTKVQGLQDLGAIGTIFVNELETYVANSYNTFPVSEITAQAANDVFNYISSTTNPIATILPTITVTKFKPAPVVAYFSSRGPSGQTRNLIKPDISAPGVNILASWIPTSAGVPSGQKPSQFNLVSGTSMACPHVAGIAATIKAWNPTWSPFAIRSAIMTTATQVNSDKMPLTTASGAAAILYDIGSGEVVPTAALQPGLVYDLTTRDLLLFLCNYGYNSSKISLISNNTNGFSCPSNSSKDLISDLNYPSIAVSGLKQNEVRTVNRVVTNVGAKDETMYTATVKSPAGLDVKVVPDKLNFSKSSKSLSFQVSFTVKSSNLQGDLFGSITWSDGTHTVRSPFAVNTAS